MDQRQADPLAPGQRPERVVGTEVHRLIDGGGVRVDSGVVSDKGLKLGAGTYVLQVGKRKFAKVTLG